MKIHASFMMALLLSNTDFLYAAPVVNPPAQDLPQPTSYQVTGRSGNSKVWERTIYERGPSGQAVPKKHHYTEMASGMHYWSNGQWVESKAEIDILPQGGAAATQGQHQAYFPSDIYSGEIELVTPDGQHLKSRPMGLSYDDGTNTVLIAELTNSVGVLVSSNQIVYPNAFTDFKADLLYTYTKAGFEQDIVLQEQPPTPESLGLNSQNTRLQVLTEFFDTVSPTQKEFRPSPQDGLSDTTLTFGKMQMVRGKAFLVGNADPRASEIGGFPVYKSWQQLDGRTFLVEELPYRHVAAQLQQMSANATANKSTQFKVSKTRLLPPMRLVQKAGTNTIQLAKADLNWKRGVVLDYVTLDSDQTDFIFQSDSTYLISGAVNFSGTVTFEGGTVIKYDTEETSAIQIWCPVICKTSTYRPAVFTSCNDDTVGESTYEDGAPEYYDNVLSIDGPSAGDDITMQDLRISYTYYGLHPAYGVNFTLRDSQFINCVYVFQPEWMSCYFNNVLVSDVGTFFNGAGSSLGVTHLTMDGCSSDLADGWYDDPADSSVAITNSLLVNVASDGSVAVTTNYTATLASASGVFQVVGAGSHYLATNSIYRNAGTTNIDPAVLADIATKTTYPPIVYSNVTISAATAFSAQAQRDSDTPDLGYHYDPLDYAFGGVNSSSNLTFTAGTDVGWFELPGSGGAGYGISLPEATSATFKGTATAPCTFARYDTVQEGANGNWTDKGYLGGIVGIDSSDDFDYTPQAVAQFTRFALLANDPNDFRDDAITFMVRASNCEFWSGDEGGFGLRLYLTNCLIDGCFLGVEADSSTGVGLVLRDCTMREASILTAHWGGSVWPQLIVNCAFDGTAFDMDDNSGGDTNITYCDFNSFLLGADRTIVEGGHDLTITNGYDWQTSWLGNYYLPSDSPLIDMGNPTADLIGLYHFTTQTSQAVEGDSTVDIGYHYVATDAYGIPLDYDSDGIPDYIEDANGNGVVDSGETDWQSATDLGLKVRITKPKKNTILP